ncbi:hypothetical protein LCGC14_2122440 [marine sediment metagenome]|uniref:Uncharacterized protein n=1 Tax=marine sediment metagenome TaxID=412755 RepID=A0A0F9E3T2_9ZZZZ
MDKQKLMSRLNIVFQTYPSSNAYLNNEATIRDYKLDVRDGNKALMTLIDELAHEM